MIENKYSEYSIFLGDFFSESMKKGSGGRITSLTLEKKGDGKEGGRGRGRLGDATGNAAARAAAGSGGRAGGGGPATWRAAESRVGQRRAVSAAPLLIAPGAAAGGGWIQRPWRRRRRRQLPSDPRQRLLDCSPYAGDMGTQQPLPSLGGPLPRPRHQRGRPPAPRLCSVPAQEVSALCPQSGALSAAVGPAPPCFLPSFQPSFLCHSARTAAAAAAATRARIRPGQGLLCVRSAVCAAA